MMSFSNQDSSAQQADERLGNIFYKNGRYNALFLGAAGLGFVVIYVLTRFRFLGEPSPQLLYISGAIFFLAIAQFPTLNLARQKRGIAANFVGALSVIIFAVLLTSFWEGIAPVAIVLIFVTPLASIPAGMPRKYYPHFLVLIISGITGILYANANPLSITRLRTDTTVAIAALAFLSATGLLLLTATIVARSSRYRSLRNQLLTSFVIIVTIPTLMAAILSAIGAYVNNESQVRNVLETVSKLKEDQINAVIDNFKVDLLRISRDSGFSKNALKILTPGETDQTNLELYRTFARNRLVDLQSTNAAFYSEIMVLNIKGEVVVSTDINREGKSLRSELFFREGSIGTFTGFSKNPTFGDANLISSAPFYDTDGNVVRGIVVLRANSKLIKAIVENTPGFTAMETYLLEKRSEITTTGEQETLSPLTQTRTTPATFNTQELRTLLNSSAPEGNSTYKNYASAPVLGYYKHIKFLNVFIIAEVPREYILNSSINSLLGSATLAIFAILIAIAAVAISASSIAEPISALASIAEGFAAGKLSARASINRRDEIGALGNAYDQMAEQLQDIIGKLEQRVADRTKDLENQSLRLRASAEIARDAATAHNLTELLDKAGTLIQNRFELYHTGIFLLDNNKEFAVLTASPTEAGKQMIANNHKLRIGEVGIVGRVAFTEEPRITLDTGADAVFFNNPYLPNTRSEMALPLKVENRMIGVLDVQSDQPQAFDEGDIAIMQILADQLATAIERARLLQQVEQNLSDLQKAYGQFTREGWKTLGESGLLTKTGYRFDNIRIQSISETPVHGDEVMKTGSAVIRNRTTTGIDENQVVIPIKLRGQTIGVVSANLKDGFSQNTITTLELAIERLAQSLESARLTEQSRQRADREQAIAQIAANISSATEFDAILRTTVEEVGKSLSDAEVSIQIINTVD